MSIRERSLGGSGAAKKCADWTDVTSLLSTHHLGCFKGTFVCKGNTAVTEKFVFPCLFFFFSFWLKGREKAQGAQAPVSLLSGPALQPRQGTGLGDLVQSPASPYVHLMSLWTYFFDLVFKISSSKSRLAPKQGHCWRHTAETSFPWTSACCKLHPIQVKGRSSRNCPQSIISFREVDGAVQQLLPRVGIRTGSGPRPCHKIPPQRVRAGGLYLDYPPAHFPRKTGL